MNKRSFPSLFGLKRTGASHSDNMSTINPALNCLDSSRYFGFGPARYGCDLDDREPRMGSILCSFKLMYPKVPSHIGSFFFKMFLI